MRCSRTASSASAPPTGLPSTRSGELLDLDESLGGRAIRDRGSLICHDALTDQRVNAARVAATGVRSMIAVPLLHAGQPVGSLLVLAQRPAAFDDEDVRTLELLSVVISASMSHASEFQAKREQVEALMRFRTIFEGASVGIVRIGADGRAIEVNAAVLEMLGYSAEEHAIGGIEACTHPDDLPQSIELLRELMDGERDAYEHDKRYVRKDGEVIWAHVRGWLEPPRRGRVAHGDRDDREHQRAQARRARPARPQRTAGARGRDAARHRGCRRGPRERDAADRRALTGADRRPTARS